MTAANHATVLRDRFGDDGYDALDEMIALRQQNLLTGDVFEARFASEFSQLRTELRGEMQQLRADIRVDLAERSAELMKWAMLFWVAQAAAVAGIITALR